MAPIRQIEKKLAGPTQNAELLRRYIGAVMSGQRSEDEQSRLIYWGHKVSTQRRIAKERFSFSHLGEDAQWDLWLAVWNDAKIYDVKSVALLWLGAPERRALRLRRWRDVMAMASTIDNWAHSDGLSSILAEILEDRPLFFGRLKKWNVSKNPWLRRQSLVAIYYYVRSRKKPIPVAQALPLVKRLLRDPHFYVQRGVGWTLREVDRVDTRKQRAFVRKHVHHISATAWFATSELYPIRLRKQLVALRRAQR